MATNAMRRNAKLHVYQTRHVPIAGGGTTDVSPPFETTPGAISFPAVDGLAGILDLATAVAQRFQSFLMKFGINPGLPTDGPYTPKTVPIDPTKLLLSSSLDRSLARARGRLRAAVKQR